MKARPPEFMQNPSLLALRKQLSDICTEALAIAKLPKGSGKGSYESSYDFNSPEYTKLLFKREIVLEKIRKLWNGDK